jgi:hypothetical protein
MKSASLARDTSLLKRGLKEANDNNTNPPEKLNPVLGAVLGPIEVGLFPPALSRLLVVSLNLSPFQLLGVQQ